MRLLLVVLLCVCCLTSGCNSPNNRITVVQREQLYRLHCSGCHGDGSGNGHIAPTLPVRPRNLKFREWQDSVTDQHIFRIIRDGGTAVRLNESMPAFSTKLEQAEIEALVRHVRALGR